MAQVSGQRLQKNPIGRRASRVSSVVVAWLVLSLPLALAPCCEAIAGLLLGATAHAGDGHAHDDGEQHHACAAFPDHPQALPGGLGPDHKVRWVAPEPAVLSFAPAAPPAMRVGAPLAPARAPPYLLLGRLLI